MGRRPSVTSGRGRPARTTSAGHTLRLRDACFASKPGPCPRSFPNWGGPPPGTLADVWGRLGLPRGGCSWHRAGGGHGRCSAPHGARDGPTEGPARCPQCEGSRSAPAQPGPQAVSCPVTSTDPHVPRSPGGRRRLRPWRRLTERHAQRKATRGPRPRPGAGASTHLCRHRVARGPRGHSSAESTSGSRLGRRERRGSRRSAPLHGSPRGPRCSPTSRRWPRVPGGPAVTEQRRRPHPLDARSSSVTTTAISGGRHDGEAAAPGARGGAGSPSRPGLLALGLPAQPAGEELSPPSPGKPGAQASCGRGRPGPCSWHWAVAWPGTGLFPAAAQRAGVCSRGPASPSPGAALARGDSAPRAHWAVSGDICSCHRGCCWH